MTAKYEKFVIQNRHNAELIYDHSFYAVHATQSEKLDLTMSGSPSDAIKEPLCFPKELFLKK